MISDWNHLYRKSCATTRALSQMSLDPCGETELREFKYFHLTARKLEKFDLVVQILGKKKRKKKTDMMVVKEKNKE